MHERFFHYHLPHTKNRWHFVRIHVFRFFLCLWMLVGSSRGGYTVHTDGVALKYMETILFLLINWPMNQHPSVLSSSTYRHAPFIRFEEWHEETSRIEVKQCSFVAPFAIAYVALFARKSLFCTKNKNNNRLPKRIYTFTSHFRALLLGNGAVVPTTQIRRGCIVFLSKWMEGLCCRRLLHLARAWHVRTDNLCSIVRTLFAQEKRVYFPF